MQKLEGYSQLQSTGARVASATITVYQTGTLTLASIFSDNLNTPLSNPFTSDANGLWFFYAANGRYDVQMSGGSPTISPAYTLSDFFLQDSNIGTLASIDLTPQSANVLVTTALITPFQGMYRVSVYIVLTQAATTSSTLPSVTVSWIDSDTGQAMGIAVTPTDATNSVAGPPTVHSAVIAVNSANSNPIAFSTNGYASVGAVPMFYTVHIRVGAA